MANRFAAVAALIVFALCLVLGISADNTFATTVSRALIALAGTFIISLLLGAAAQKMLDENIKSEEEKLKKQSSTPPEDR